MLNSRGLESSAPPDARTKLQNNPTLLFSWWCTGCAVTIVLFRLSGRKIRNARLFREDKIMALSLIPLLIRMALIHPVLLWGNNNVVTAGLSAEDIYHRSIGSRLVLGARIFYALLYVVFGLCDMFGSRGKTDTELQHLDRQVHRFRIPQAPVHELLDPSI